jgi:hypothetical protein
VQIFFLCATEVVRQMPRYRLNGFQANFSLLLGAVNSNRMTVELACSQESRNRHSLRYPEVNSTLTVAIKADFAITAYRGNETGSEAW